MQSFKVSATAGIGSFELPARLERILKSVAASLPPDTAFELDLNGAERRIGNGQVKFRVAIHNRHGVSALASMDEKRIGEAYLDGDISLEGDLVAALDLRATLTDSHPLIYLWSTYGQRLFFGQVARDKQWIHEHYDSESEFYLFFLDKQHRCYSHGYFEDDEEPLDRAIRRKLDTAIAACGIQPGWRVLDIVEMLEQDLEVPVLHAVPARVWAVQQFFQVRERVKGFGRLLAELPPPAS